MATAEIDGNVIQVETRWSEKELIKIIPGSRWNASQRVWSLPLTWVACLQLRGVFGAELVIGPDLAAWSWNEYTSRVAPATEIRNVFTVAPGVDTEGLFPFQTAGVNFMTIAGNCLIGDQLGLGKTVTALARIKTVDQDYNDLLPALVICPNSTKHGWAKASARWFPNATPYILSGGSTVRKKILDAAKDDPSALVIVNIEAVRVLSRLSGFGSIRLARCASCDARGNPDLTPAKCDVHPKPLNNFGFRTVILDEAHRIKDPHSKQTRAIWAVAHDPSVIHRFALTGTPIANHVGDLWSVLHFLEPDEHLTRSKFVDRYALQSWNAFGGLDIVGINPEVRSEFYGVLDPRFRRTHKELVLNQLPKKIRTQRWVDMGTKQQKAYNELRAQLTTIMDDGEILTVPNNLVRDTRLMQLASSYGTVEWVEQPVLPRDQCHCFSIALVRHEETCPLRMKCTVKLSEPSPKLDAMEDILDELGGKPCIIAAESKQLIMLAANRFKNNRKREKIGLITGDQDEWERQKVITQLNEGDLNAVLMTIAAGGTGVDGLQVADTMIILQRSWSMVGNIQLEGRIDRIGSGIHDSIHYIDIVTRNTIEETRLWPRLAEKLERLEEINRDRAQLLRAGHNTFELDQEESRISASMV